MIKSKLRTAERLRETWALKAPQVFPLVGDGTLASSVTRPLRGGPNAYLGTVRGRWRQVLIVPTRAELVAARYRDWLHERDQHQQAAA